MLELRIEMLASEKSLTRSETQEEFLHGVRCSYLYRIYSRIYFSL
jgi:hypothetical protein